MRTSAIQPNSLGIRGAGQGLSVALVGDDDGEMARVARGLVTQTEDDPRFGQVRLGYDITQPRLFVDIDRARAEDLGLDIDGLGAAFQAVLVFLVLSAQFESFVSAQIAMATVPLGLVCAVYALLLTGGSLNFCSQIGLVLLVGIMAKNGILIVEFADQQRDRGLPVRRAVEEAATVHLRPVMMTMIATVPGGLPLVLARGAGAAAREVPGWIIVGGLGLATLATLYVTPGACLLCAGPARPRVTELRLPDAELRSASQKG